MPARIPPPSPPATPGGAARGTAHPAFRRRLPRTTGAYAASVTTTSVGRLILLCGIAGAGKTTLAKQLEADGAVRLCPDEWMAVLGFDIYDKDGRVAVEALQWELAQALVQRGLTVVDECGVWQRWERDLRREWARAHGVPVELRFLDAPVDVLTARVAERNRTLPEGAPHIDPALIAHWDDRIQRPDAEELALFDPPVRPA